MIATPITAIRSLPPSPRRSRQSWRGNLVNSSVERLAATVTGLEVMPVGDVVLAQLPAEVHLAAVLDRWEVHEAAVDVAQHDARLLDRLQQPPHLEEGDADLVALLAAAVARGGLREGLMGFGVGQLVLGVAELAEQWLELRQQRVRLIAREVAVIGEPRALVAHGRAADGSAAVFLPAEESRSRRSSPSADPTVRSWPWKARCQCSAGHLRTCSSSGASSSAGTKSPSSSTTTGSAPTRQG